MVAPHERREPSAHHHLKATLGFSLFDHTIERQRRGYSFEFGCPRSSHSNKPSTKRYVAALMTTSSGLALPLDASGNVRRLAQREDLAFLAAADLANDD